MTDGISQGLFIVVAIVIFGIFVVMAYILFEDTLSPALASMFSQAIENVDMEDHHVRMNQLRSYDPYHVKVSGTTREMTVEIVRDVNFLAVYFPDFKLEDNSEYRITGTITINGEPATDNRWVHKQITTYADSVAFTVDSDTGYFESAIKTDRSKYVSHQQYLIHTRFKRKDGSSLKVGDQVTVKNLTLEKITK